MTAIALPGTPLRPARSCEIGVIVVGVKIADSGFIPAFARPRPVSYRQCKSGYRQTGARMLGRSQTLAGA